MIRSLVIIESDLGLAEDVRRHLECNHWHTHVAQSAEQGLDLLARLHPDVVLAGQMPDKSEGEFTSAALKLDPQIKVISLASHGREQIAFDATEAGAFHYLLKTVLLAELDVVLERAMAQAHIEHRRAILDRYQSRGIAASGSLADFIGESPVMRLAKARIRDLLESERSAGEAERTPVLVSGEPGTGKALVARALHFDGVRADRPFIELHCASLPSDALEAELFGCERGAFAAAQERRIGLVEIADGGTLFLDEVAELAQPIQARLLELLQQGSFRRMGSEREREVDVRVIAATTRDFAGLAQSGRFNGALYAGFAAVTLALPTLRSCGNDVIEIARTNLERLARRYGKDGLRFTGEAEQWLRRHDWPGNVQELRDLLERTVLATGEALIGPGEFVLAPESRARPVRIEAQPVRSISGTVPVAVATEEAEADLVLKTLEKTDWNVSKSARRLGLSRDMLRYRILKYGFARPTE